MSSLSLRASHAAVLESFDPLMACMATRKVRAAADRSFPAVRNLR
jgi:hypothetical protein